MSAGGSLTVKPTAAFARDLKRASKRGWDTSLLQALIEELRHRRPPEPRHRDHPLKGGWRGWQDCHVKDDWVLIYRVD